MPPSVTPSAVMRDFRQHGIGDEFAERFAAAGAASLPVVTIIGSPPPARATLSISSRLTEEPMPKVNRFAVPMLSADQFGGLPHPPR